PKPRPVTGGSLGYKTVSHTFLGTYDRTVSDAYGLGASTSSTANASWRWRRSRSSWWLQSSSNWQQLQGGASADLTGWRVTAGFGRMVGRHVAWLTQYAYLNYSGGVQAAASHLSQNALRVSMIWNPRAGATP